MIIQWRQSRILGNLPKNLEKAVRNENLFHYNHKFAIKRNMLESKFNLIETPALNDKFKVIAINYDESPKSKIYIAILEGKNLPFYGVQFHPEKNT